MPGTKRIRDRNLKHKEPPKPIHPSQLQAPRPINPVAPPPKLGPTNAQARESAVPRAHDPRTGQAVPVTNVSSTPVYYEEIQPEPAPPRQFGESQQVVQLAEELARLKEVNTSLKEELDEALEASAIISQQLRAMEEDYAALHSTCEVLRSETTQSVTIPEQLEVTTIRSLKRVGDDGIAECVVAGWENPVTIILPAAQVKQLVVSKGKDHGRQNKVIEKATRKKVRLGGS